MTALLLLMTSFPLCAAEPPGTTFEAWASPSCARALPALRQLAEESVLHESRLTLEWVRAAINDRSLQCHDVMPLAWTPALSSSTAGWSEADDWRWLADVGSRAEALAMISQGLTDEPGRWQWAFGWTELSAAACAGHACIVFRALRDGQWSELLDALDDATFLLPDDRAALRALALDQLGQHAKALSALHASPRRLKAVPHPLIRVLDAVYARVITNDWSRPDTAVDALEPGHALKALLKGSPKRVPAKGEHFTPFIFE